MTNEEAINEIEMIISCVKQHGIDLLDDRDIPTLESAIEALKQTQWIPCSERLPEEKDEYLTTNMFGAVCYDTWNEINFNRTEMVIAWMPLPKPYEGRKNDKG